MTASLRQRLEAAIIRHGVPGASLALWHGGELHEATAGHANLRAQTTATPDTLFQIGSITKLFTATLILGLAAEGTLTLDQPVAELLPGFALADTDAARQVTVRQLLCHSGGMDGDFFKPHGRGEDRIARYVADCRDLPQLHPPGALFSYCNSGYVILGRIIETLTGTHWDKALEERLLRPLGLRETKSLPEEAIRFRCAIGHAPHPDTGRMDITPIAYLAQSNAPAGSTVMARARDVIRLARPLFGIGGDAAAPLPAALTQQMQTAQITLPPHYPMRHWGLGPKIFDWGGMRGFGHDGVTIGQHSYLRVIPERDLAIVLLTNGGDANSLYEDLVGALLAELADIRLPQLPAPDPRAVTDRASYTGTYEKLSARIHISEVEGALQSRSEVNIDFMGGFRPMTLRLEPVDATLWLARVPDSAAPYPVRFLDFGTDGRPAFLHMGLRAYRRVA